MSTSLRSVALPRFSVRFLFPLLLLLLILLMFLARWATGRFLGDEKNRGKQQSFCSLHTLLLMCWLAYLVWSSCWARNSSAFFRSSLSFSDCWARCVFTSVIKVPKAEATRADMYFSPPLNTSIQCQRVLVCPRCPPLRIHFPFLTMWPLNVKFHQQVQENLTATASPCCVKSKPPVTTM